MTAISLSVKQTDKTLFHHEDRSSAHMPWYILDLTHSLQVKMTTNWISDEQQICTNDHSPLNRKLPVNENNAANDVAGFHMT